MSIKYRSFCYDIDEFSCLCYRDINTFKWWFAAYDIIDSIYGETGARIDYDNVLKGIDSTIIWSKAVASSSVKIGNSFKNSPINDDAIFIDLIGVIQIIIELKIPEYASILINWFTSTIYKLSIDINDEEEDVCGDDAVGDGAAATTTNTNYQDVSIEELAKKNKYFQFEISTLNQRIDDLRKMLQLFENDHNRECDDVNFTHHLYTIKEGIAVDVAGEIGLETKNNLFHDNESLNFDSDNVLNDLDSLSLSSLQSFKTHTCEDIAKCYCVTYRDFMYICNIVNSIYDNLSRFNANIKDNMDKYNESKIENDDVCDFKHLQVLLMDIWQTVQDLNLTKPSQQTTL